MRGDGPCFRSVTDPHPAGRYVCRQRECSGIDLHIVLQTDGHGLWCLQFKGRDYAAEDPVGQTYGPIPEWPA